MRGKFAMQLRVNAEAMAADASVRPSHGTITVFEVPSGPGLRVDSYAYAGYSTNARFDSLLAKLIVSSSSPHFAETVNKAYRALSKFRIEGVATNLGFLQAVLQHADFRAKRKQRFDDMVVGLYQRGKALNVATILRLTM